MTMRPVATKPGPPLGGQSCTLHPTWRSPDGAARSKAPPRCRRSPCPPAACPAAAMTLGPGQPWGFASGAASGPLAPLPWRLAWAPKLRCGAQAREVRCVSAACARTTSLSTRMVKAKKKPAISTDEADLAPFGFKASPLACSSAPRSRTGTKGASSQRRWCGCLLLALSLRLGADARHRADAAGHHGHGRRRQVRAIGEQEGGAELSSRGRVRLAVHPDVPRAVRRSCSPTTRSKKASWALLGCAQI